MKIVTNFVQRVGIDRLLHFFVSAMLTALSLPWGYCAAIVIGFFVFILGAIKEDIDSREPDNEYDLYDTLANLLGVVFIILWSFLASYIGEIPMFVPWSVTHPNL